MIVGRTAELARLRSALGAEPPRASHRLVFLEGAIGIGKSALVNEFLAAWRGARILFARADELDSRIPFDGIRGILESLLDTELGPLLQAHRSPRALLRSVRTGLVASPALLVIDDAHWLDAASITLIEQLLLEPASPGLRLLISHRTGRAPGALAAAARRSGSSMHRIVLAPLAPEDASALLSTQGVDDARLVALGGGNPLFLRLLAEGHHRSGAMQIDPIEAVGASLDDALRGELLALDEEARALLGAMSLRQTVPPGALHLVAGLSEEAGARAADRLAARGLIDVERMRVAHPLVQAAAYRGMSSSSRHRAHRRAAQHASDAIERASQLQHLGAMLDDAELAVIVEAAAIVLATSPQSCIGLLERTRRVPSRERDLLLARALLLDGRPAEAEGLIRAAYRAEEPSGAALALLIQCLRIQGRPDEALELALDASPAASSPEVAVELATLEVMHDGSPSIRSNDRLEALDPASNPPLAAAMSALRALAGLRDGELELARREYASAKHGFARLSGNEVLSVIDAATALGWCAHFLGDFEAGAELLERALGLAERHGRFHALPHLYVVLAFICIPLDRCTEAEEFVELAIDAGRRYNWPDAIPLAATAALVAAPGRVSPADFHTRYRRLQDAGLPQIAWWRRIVELFSVRAAIRLGLEVDHAPLAVGPHDLFGGQKHLGLGELALASGDPATALQHAEAAIAVGLRARHASQTGHGLLFRSQLFHVLGRNADAREDANRAADCFRRGTAPLYAGFAERWVQQLSTPGPSTPGALTEQGGRAASLEGAALTPRERTVAELVAEGRSNRDIAATLHLSPRTVETHVSRILRKTGLRSRAGLARRLDAAG